MCFKLLLIWKFADCGGLEINAIMNKNSSTKDSSTNTEPHSRILFILCKNSRQFQGPGPEFLKDISTQGSVSIEYTCSTSTTIYEEKSDIDGRSIPQLPLFLPVVTKEVTKKYPWYAPCWLCAQSELESLMARIVRYEKGETQGHWPSMKADLDSAWKKYNNPFLKDSGVYMPLWAAQNNLKKDEPLVMAQTEEIVKLFSLPDK